AEGEYVEFFENGIIKKSGTYKSGNKHGEWLLFDDSGKVMSKEKYKNGVLK
ncbi:MAG: membrane-binding protein, partial [Bacteroidetes bacterium CG18_big_fil_WC_8_21_14_2_50_41_14]